MRKGKSDETQKWAGRALSRVCALSRAGVALSTSEFTGAEQGWLWGQGPAPHHSHRSLETHLCAPVPQGLSCCKAFALTSLFSPPFPHPMRARCPLVFLGCGLLRSADSVLSLAWGQARSKCLMSTWMCCYSDMCSSTQKHSVAYQCSIAQRHSR